MELSWKQVIVAFLIYGLVMLSLLSWAMSKITTEDDGFTDTSYRIQVSPEYNNFHHYEEIEYIIYLPLPLYNNSTSPIMENLVNISGDAEYEIIDTAKGKALKIEGNGTVNFYFHERLEIERGVTNLSLINSSTITSQSTQIENMYWLYYNSSSTRNISLSVNYYEGYASGTYYWDRETWVSFKDVVLVNGWQLAEGYADSPDHLKDAP